MQYLRLHLRRVHVKNGDRKLSCSSLLWIKIILINRKWATAYKSVDFCGSYRMWQVSTLKHMLEAPDVCIRKRGNWIFQIIIWEESWKKLNEKKKKLDKKKSLENLKLLDVKNVVELFTSSWPSGLTSTSIRLWPILIRRGRSRSRYWRLAPNRTRFHIWKLENILFFIERAIIQTTICLLEYKYFQTNSLNSIFLAVNMNPKTLLVTL